MKPDELTFRLLAVTHGNIPPESWDELTNRHIYLLEKWTRKGWWNYGVSLRAGWLTEAGKTEFKKHNENQ